MAKKYGINKKKINTYLTFVVTRNAHDKPQMNF